MNNRCVHEKDDTIGVCLFSRFSINITFPEKKTPIDLGIPTDGNDGKVQHGDGQVQRCSQQLCTGQTTGRHVEGFFYKKSKWKLACFFGGSDNGRQG